MKIHSETIRHLNIEVTKRCNQRCFYCFNDSGLGKPGSELSLEQWVDILHELQPRGLRSIHLTGGEPFAYRHAVALLSAAQEMGLRTSILSNGFHVPQLAKSYPHVFANLEVAQLSLDSMQPDLHNRRRGYPRAWDDAISAIRCLREMGVPVEVSCVLNDENLSHVTSIGNFCHEIGASLLLRPIIKLGRSNSEASLETIAAVDELKIVLPVPLVVDRYHYVPETPDIEFNVANAGIRTIRHDGKLREIPQHV